MCLVAFVVVALGFAFAGQPEAGCPYMRFTDQNAVYFSFTVLVAPLAMLGRRFQETIPPSTFVKVPTKFAFGVQGFGPVEVLIAHA